MRLLRLVSHAGLRHSTLIDEKTGGPVPDVLRIEFAPLELYDGRWFAVILIHRRDERGEFMYETDATPMTDRESVELVVGNIWSI